MINFKAAKAAKVVNRNETASELEIDLDGSAVKAIAYHELCGPVEVGDRVIVNTTALDLSLGTGGYAFVLWNLSRGGDLADEGAGQGHLMKLRYTPLQRAGLSVEEEAGPYHGVLKDVAAIEGLPVVACELHSQLLPVAATVAELAPGTKVAYIMTDGGALPASFSRAARWLRANGYLEAVITSGQSFGGDYEAVNVYSALAAAKYVVGADIAVVAMGPGIAGTGTRLGHTGIEQGQTINAAASLKGEPIAVLRLSQADLRPRHRGISHHTVAALVVAALAPAIVPVPELPADMDDFSQLIRDQLQQSGIIARHNVGLVGSAITLPALAKIVAQGGPEASTMGRGPAEEPAFFVAAGAAAVAAIALIERGRRD